ncbi:MAG: hypothetical protein HUU25_11625 [Candidatus Sumerlaeia bacterium]|nr:hypothetical protein [Candidatus Sumerlaeia bacterium]
MRRLSVLCLLTATLSGAATAAPLPEAAQALAGRCGLAAWSQVDEIRYTFNVQSSRGETHRSWVWEPRTGRVTLTSPDATEEITYNHGGPPMSEGDPLRETDHRFINDKYWLLFPLHLAWDSGVTVTDDGPQPAPFGLGTLPSLTAHYGGEGGYTPGDSYQLHLGEDGLPVAWTFRSGGEGEGRPMTWDGWSRLGPLLLSLDHTNPESGTRLWFTDVSATIGGEVVTPQPLE